MTDRKKAVQCLECGKQIADQQKLRVHMQFKHPFIDTDKQPAPVADTAAPAAPIDATAATGGPAIDPAGAEQLRNQEPEPEPAPAGAHAESKAEVHTLERDKRDYERSAAATLRSTDKLISKVTGVPSSEEEIEDLIETSKAAAAHYGPRLGAFFWLLVFLVGIASYGMGKMFVSRQQRRAQVGTAPGPLSSDGTASRGPQ